MPVKPWGPKKRFREGYLEVPARVLEVRHVERDEFEVVLLGIGRGPSTRIHFSCDAKDAPVWLDRKKQELVFAVSVKEYKP